MNTDELLVAIRPEFPELTDKTLRDWVKEGFLQPPVRVGMGSEGGTPNEWADDSIARIRVIKSVTNKRVDKTRARRALIANGYFIGVAALRDELLGSIEAIHNTFSSPKQFDDGGTIKSGNGGVLDDDLKVIISTALISPTPLFDKLHAVMCEYTTDDQRVDPSPLTEVLELFSIYRLEHDLNDVTDRLLVEAFNDATNLFNVACPIVGWLYGYDCYTPISNSSVVAKYVTRKSQTPKIERYEFEYLMRLVCIAGCITVNVHKDRLLELLPVAFNYAFTYTQCDVKEDELESLTVEKDNKRIYVDEIKSEIVEAMTLTHKDNIQFTQSLFK